MLDCEGGIDAWLVGRIIVRMNDLLYSPQRKGGGDHGESNEKAEESRSI